MTASAVVVLASAGRPDLLGDVLLDLRQQTASHTVVVSVPDRMSLPTAMSSDVTVVHARGLAAQRNAGIAAAPRDSIIFCFDDDSVVSPDYIERALDIFNRYPSVVGLTGRVLLDGATGDAITRADAVAELKSAAGDRRGSTRAWKQLYGCNFAFRRSAAPDEEFDARLPLYSWLEDHDFARRLLRYGGIVKVDDCVIVHRGVKSGGRAAHARLGYSQMMNPLYLHRKGSFPTWLTIKEIVPRCSKNLLLSVAGSGARWRRERLRGNIAAAKDAMKGMFDPERMLEY